jgi:hypothetical protein
MSTLPKLNLSLNERERARLDRLAQIRGTKVNRAVNEAVIHILASIELNEAIHYTVPSEQGQREPEER